MILRIDVSQAYFIQYTLFLYYLKFLSVLHAFYVNLTFTHANVIGYTERHAPTLALRRPDSNDLFDGQVGFWDRKVPA